MTRLRINPWILALIAFGITFVVLGVIAPPLALEAVVEEATEIFPTATAVITPTQPPTAEVVDVVDGLAMPNSDQCMACHTNAEQLQGLAVEVEEASLSSGPG